MKKIRIPSFMLLIALVLSLVTPPARALDDPKVDTSHAVVLLAENGSNESVIYTKNEHERLYPASLTKIMTVLLAIEDIESGAVKLTDMVTAQPGFDFDMIVNGTSANLVAGETMSLENLLYCCLLASANDASNVIAMYLSPSGTVGEFVDRMNRRAEELGCTDTHFVNPHGLPDPNHYTTAWDFSRILREAATHELFLQISSTINYTVPDTNMASERRLENTNSLINPTNAHYPGDYGYEYAGGGKTGYTSDAGYCLAATAEKDGIQLLSVVMKAEAYPLEDGSGWYYGHFADTRTLFEWAFANFSYQEIVRSTEIVGEVAVEMGADADSVSVRPSTSITALLPNDVDLEEFTRTVTLYPEENGEPLVAPVDAGQAVGEISVSLNGTVYGTATLVTSTSVDMSRTQFMRNELMDTLRQPAVIFTFWGLVLLFTLYLLLVVRYRAKRRAYQKRLEAARQVRLDLEDEEDEIRYERRVRSTAGAKPSPGKVEVVLEPESLRKKEEETPAPPAVDEPTRVSGPLPEITDEPTRSDLPVVQEETPAPEEDPSPAETEEPAPAECAEDGDAPSRDYFEEFFGKK